MNWITNHKKINLTVLIGLILIISALSIWIYSIIELKGNEILLTIQNIPLEEVWRAEGALQWWKNFYTTTIIPATTILTLAGIATILSPQLRGFAQKVALRKRGLTVVEEEAVASKDNSKEEPTVVLQNLISEEANLKGEMKELEFLRENLQLKFKEDIQRKKNSIQKLRAEINDLKFMCEELSKSPKASV